jgi:hypothetical protein
MESNQYFIIWHHGFKYIKEILDIIRNNNNVKITHILKRKVSLDKFIHHIYKLDKSSWQHLDVKTKYLKNIKHMIYIIFIKDLNTIYKYKPNNNHKYSFHETFIKWKIRLKFNPRTQDKQIIITDNVVNDASIQKRWPNFITHQHVIHSSDIEEETSLILEYFKLNKDEIFDLTGNIYFNYSKKIINVDCDKIVVNTTYKDYINVRESPHYKYLLGEKNQYDNYILQSLGTIICHDNLSGAFDKLINNFEYGKVIQNVPNYIICNYNKDIDKYIVYDGLHRLSILVFNNIKNIKIYLLE